MNVSLDYNRISFLLSIKFVKTDGNFATYNCFNDFNGWASVNEVCPLSVDRLTRLTLSLISKMKLKFMGCVEDSDDCDDASACVHKHDGDIRFIEPVCLMTLQNVSEVIARQTERESKHIDPHGFLSIMNCVSMHNIFALKLILSLFAEMYLSQSKEFALMHWNVWFIRVSFTKSLKWLLHFWLQFVSNGLVKVLARFL